MSASRIDVGDRLDRRGASQPREATPCARDFVLEVSDFSVHYGVDANMVQAVHDVTLNLRRATVLGVAGESGSGKSTLVYALTRLLRPPGVISGGRDPRLRAAPARGLRHARR